MEMRVAAAGSCWNTLEVGHGPRSRSGQFDTAIARSVCMFDEQAVVDRLRKQICNIVLGFNVGHEHLTVSNALTDEVPGIDA
eukprot:3709234-Rhodomonas_salina.1